MNSLKDIAKVLKRSKKVALFTHDNPDSDALGSVFGMYYALKSLGKDAEIFIRDNISDTNKRLVDTKLINNGECNITSFDTLMCCDVSDTKRLGEYAYVFDIKNNTIVLDHHFTTKLIGKYNHVDASISSCCELVYDLIKLMKGRLNSRILSCIYMGLTSDTNSFMNSNTNEHSYRVAYEIAKSGLDINAINEILYKSVTRKEISFKQYLWNNYKVDKDIAYVLMDYKTLQELKGGSTDCSGFSSKLLTIANVNYSFSIIEKEKGLYSLSLRSRAGYNVRLTAEKLGGGGHSCAAGAKINSTSLNKLKKEVIDAIRQK